MNFKDYIIRDPKVRNGVPVIKGTKITLKTVLGHLLLGDSIENIVETYPGLTTGAIRAVIAYAAGVAGLDVPEDGPFKQVSLKTLPPSGVGAGDVSGADPQSIQTHLLSDAQVSALLESVQFKRNSK